MHTPSPVWLWIRRICGLFVPNFVNLMTQALVQLCYKSSLRFNRVGDMLSIDYWFVFWSDLPVTDDSKRTLKIGEFPKVLFILAGQSAIATRCDNYLPHGKTAFSTWDDNEWNKGCEPACSEVVQISVTNKRKLVLVFRNSSSVGSSLNPFHG